MNNRLKKYLSNIRLRQIESFHDKFNLNYRHTSWYNSQWRFNLYLNGRRGKRRYIKYYFEKKLLSIIYAYYLHQYEQVSTIFKTFKYSERQYPAYDEVKKIYGDHQKRALHLSKIKKKDKPVATKRIVLIRFDNEMGTEVYREQFELSNMIHAMSSSEGESNVPLYEVREINSVNFSDLDAILKIIPADTDLIILLAHGSYDESDMKHFYADGTFQGTSKKLDMKKAAESFKSFGDKDFLLIMCFADTFIRTLSSTGKGSVVGCTEEIWPLPTIKPYVLGYLNSYIFEDDINVVHEKALVFCGMFAGGIEKILSLRP